MNERDKDSKNNHPKNKLKPVTSRLRKVAKPRPKKKELVLIFKGTFECFNDNPKLGHI